MEESKKTYGKVICPEGEFDIVNFIITDTVEGRQWKIILLSDGSICLDIESRIEGTDKVNNQKMRLTQKSLTILNVCFGIMDKNFNLNMQNIAKEMFADDSIQFSYPKVVSPESLENKDQSNAAN